MSLVRRTQFEFDTVVPKQILQGSGSARFILDSIRVEEQRKIET